MSSTMPDNSNMPGFSNMPGHFYDMKGTMLRSAGTYWIHRFYTLRYCLAQYELRIPSIYRIFIRLTRIIRLRSTLPFNL